MLSMLKRKTQSIPPQYGSMNSSISKSTSHSNVKVGSSTSEVDSAMDRFESHSPYFSSSDLLSQSDIDGSGYTSNEELSPDEEDSRAMLMATVLVEDAIEHRSIHHKLDSESLLRYRLYHSTPVRWVLRITITVLLALAFFEKPSSLTSSSDPHKRGKRPELPCGVTETIEFFCLIILTVDLMFRGLMVGKRQMKKNYWLMAFLVVLGISYLDWSISIGYLCTERWRIRRILRPFFLIQNSSLMKKTVQSILHSLPQILSVLFLMFLHIYFFTMLGMVLFSPNNFSNHSLPLVRDSSLDSLNDRNEGKAYFKDVGTAVISLIVLLTTANNPDVMMPAYSDHRLYSLYFILFLAIGLYFFMNVLLAVIYNQFKGSFTKTMQSSFSRRRIGIRAAFEVLRGHRLRNCPDNISVVYLTEVSLLLDKVRFSKKSRYLPALYEYLKTISTPGVTAKQFQELFDTVYQDSVKKRYPCRNFRNPTLRQIQAVLLHDYFQYFGDFISLVNVLIVTIQLATINKNTFVAHSQLSIFNFCFILYYAIEQILMIVFVGPRRYFTHKNVWFESLVTWLLVILEMIYIGLYGGPFPYISDAEIMRRSELYEHMSIFNLLRITNMLIIIRLLRIIPSIKPLSMVAKTLVDLVKNMRSFGGIVIMIFYVFAVIGIMIFEGKSPQPPMNNTSVMGLSNDIHSASKINITCGSYEQLGYYANNFDDFAAALVVLWDVMVVNNWFIFLEVYTRMTGSRLSQTYFILWWLVSAVVCINLFVALVIEAFLTQWDKQIVVKKPNKKRKYAHSEETSRHFRVHEWFRANYREPAEDEILAELWSHHYLRKYIFIDPRLPSKD